MHFKCTVANIANISQDSKATDGTTLIYADIDPNAVNRVQKVVASDDSNYKVQYAAINYSAKAPQNLCVPIASKVIEDELKSGSHIHEIANHENKLISTCYVMYSLHVLSPHTIVVQTLF